MSINDNILIRNSELFSEKTEIIEFLQNLLCNKTKLSGGWFEINREELYYYYSGQTFKFTHSFSFEKDSYKLKFELRHYIEDTTLLTMIRNYSAIGIKTSGNIPEPYQICGILYLESWTATADDNDDAIDCWDIREDNDELIEWFRGIIIDCLRLK